MFDHKEPHTMSFPEPWNKFNSFERMMVLRCIRPDKVVPAAQLFVEGKSVRGEKKNYIKNIYIFVTNKLKNALNGYRISYLR